MTTTLDLDELERLEKAATPGPWAVVKNRNQHWGMREVLGPTISVMGFTLATDVTAKRAARVEADTALIAAMRNALPALIAAAREAERLRRENAAWVDAFNNGSLKAAEARVKVLEEALARAERKLSAYVGVCKGDKELTDAVLPMCREALGIARCPACDGRGGGGAQTPDGMEWVDCGDCRGRGYVDRATLSPPQPAQDTAQTAAQDVDGMGPNGPVLADNTPTSGWLRVELDAATNEVAGWGEGMRRGIPVAEDQDKPEMVCPVCGSDPSVAWSCDACWSAPAGRTRND